jgi:hypothetical protein
MAKGINTLGATRQGITLQPTPIPRDFKGNVSQQIIAPSRERRTSDLITDESILAAKVNTFIVAGTDITVAYDDGAETYTINANAGAGSPLTTKGDLYTYSTATARLGVGTNGQVLTADSGEATGLKWAAAAGGGDGMLKTKDGGYFLIPTGPGIGTATNSSASADTYGGWAQLSASAPADLFIVGFRLYKQSSSNVVYVNVDIGTGAAASETSVGELCSGYDDVVGGTAEASIMQLLPYPIPVASGTRIAARTADSLTASVSHRIVLICVNQADLEAI